jgi:hypothetical protein
VSNKLTIAVDDEVYQGLHRIIVPRRISRFLNDLARRHVLSHKLRNRSMRAFRQSLQN